VNFYGGPGAGKSSMANIVFAKLKWSGMDCELASEYAKDVVWEERYHLLNNQLYIAGVQYHRVNRLVGKIGIVLTDSPVMLSIIYNKVPSKHFDMTIFEHYKRHTNLNLFIERIDDIGFEMAGRVHGEAQSLVIDSQIKRMLDKYKLEYHCFKSGWESVDRIIALIQQKAINE
jgi:hypothetical protein